MRDMESQQMLVSIVVTTRNEEKNIDACLQSILLQDYSNIELIVIDNASSDQTKNIAGKYTDLVFDRGPERSAQRNFGLLQIAKGQILAYIDADMVLGPRVVREAVGRIREGCVGVFVPEIVLGSRYVARLRRFEREFYDGTPIDAVRFIRADAFRAVGGFDEELFKSGSGEDWDLDLLLAQKGSFAKIPRTAGAPGREWPFFEWCMNHGVQPTIAAGIYHNESDIRVGEYLRKKSYYATGFAGYIEKWGSDNPSIRRQFSASYRFVGVFIENGKWRRIARRPNLYIGVLGLRFMVGLAYLRSKL